MIVTIFRAALITIEDKIPITQNYHYQLYWGIDKNGKFVDQIVNIEQVK